MQFEIFKGDSIVNIIESDEEFCRQYCADFGYTYQLREYQAGDHAPTPPTTETQVLGREITDLNLEQIAMGQEITELQLMFMEGGKAVV